MFYLLYQGEKFNSNRVAFEAPVIYDPELARVVSSVWDSLSGWPPSLPATLQGLLGKRVPADGCVHVPPSISAMEPEISRVRSWAFRRGTTATADDQGARRDSRSAVASARGKQMDMFNTLEMNYAAGPKPGNPLSHDGLCVKLWGWNKSLVWCLGFYLPMHYIQLQSPWRFPRNAFPFHLTGLAHLCLWDSSSNGIVHLLTSVEHNRRYFEKCLCPYCGNQWYPIRAING